MVVFAYWTSTTSWLLVALVVILLFGGSKLPQMARGLGEAAKELKKATGAEGESTETK